MSDITSQTTPVANLTIQQACPGCRKVTPCELSDYTQILYGTQLIWVEFRCAVCDCDVRLFVKFEIELEAKLVSSELYSPNSLLSRRLISCTSGVVSWRPESPGQPELIVYLSLLTAARA